MDALLGSPQTQQATHTSGRINLPFASWKGLIYGIHMAAPHNRERLAHPVSPRVPPCPSSNWRGATGCPGDGGMLFSFPMINRRWLSQRAGDKPRDQSPSLTAWCGIPGGGRGVSGGRPCHRSSSQDNATGSSSRQQSPTCGHGKRLGRTLILGATNH